MEKDDKGSTMIRMGVSGWMFLLVPAYPGCPGSKAVKRSLLLLLLPVPAASRSWEVAARWHRMSGSGVPETLQKRPGEGMGERNRVSAMVDRPPDESC